MAGFFVGIEVTKRKNLRERLAIMYQLIHHTPVQEIKHAYSYTRLSSKRQLGEGKTGEQRQLSKPADICQQHGWTLCKDTFTDLGVSGFTGKNILKGSLGEFIRLAIDGKLLPHPCLIIEAFDRFSRQDIDESEGALIDLLKAGVAVHVAFSGKTFTKESTKSLADRIEILVAMKQAHEYSANLSKRVASAKRLKKSKVHSGSVENINEMLPAYLEYDKESKAYRFIEEQAAIARYIFKSYAANETICHIASILNEQGKPSFKNKKWHRASIRYILSNPAAYGQFDGKDNVLPALIDKNTFDAVQVMLEKNKNRRGKRADLVNIFRGLVTCSCCGSSMHMQKNKGRNYAYYRCPGVPLGICNHPRGIRVNLVEEEIFAIVLRKSPEEFLVDNSVEINAAIQLERDKKELLTKKISQLIDLDMDVTEVKAKLQTLVNERKAVEARLVELQGAVVTTTASEGLGDIREFLTAQDEDDYYTNLQEQLKDIEMRKKLQGAVPKIITNIKIDTERAVLDIKFVGGKVIQSSIVC